MGGGAKCTIISKIPKKVASCIWIQKRIKGAILYTNYSQKRGKVLNGTKGVLTTKEGRVLNVKEGRRSTPMKWEMDKWGGGKAKWTIISKIPKKITTRILIKKCIKR